MNNKICFISMFSGYAGGGEIYLKRLIEKLVETNKYEITVITPSVDFFSDIKGVDVHKVTGIDKVNFLKGLRKFVKSIFEIKTILNNGYDRIIVNGDRASYISPFLNAGDKLYCIRHMAIDGVLKSIISRISFVFYKKVITISKFHKENYINKTKIKEEDKIEVIYNSVDEEKFVFSNPVDNKNLEMIFIASLERRKGIFDLLFSINELVKSGHMIALKIVGDGYLKNEVINYIEMNNLNTVDLLGFREDIKDLISKADILVLPSYDEGLPLSILEALSSGRPVIATRIAGIPEVVSDENNGFLFNPGDTKELTHCILKFNDDKNKIRLMGHEGRKVIENKFCQSVWLNKWISVLDS